MPMPMRLGSARIRSATSSFRCALAWSGETTPFLFRGYHYTRQLSEISGTMWIKYSHEPWNVSLPLADRLQSDGFDRSPPAAYIIPRQWTHVIDVLAAHQVEMQRTTAPWTGQVETYRCSGMAVEPRALRRPPPDLSRRGSQPSPASSATAL